MIDYKDILFFDCETTGLPEKNADWATDYESFPYICQLAWSLGEREENHIVFPDYGEIPQAATDIHGITTERALQQGKPFSWIVDRFISDCLQAKLICGHNLYFDVSVIKANIMRELGQIGYDVMNAESALWKGKRIDTMRPSMAFVDARFPNGRLKFPKLEQLYSRCFPGQSFPAHDAMQDVRACRLCLPVLVENGIIELKVKEYPDETQPSIQEKAVNSPTIDFNAKDGECKADAEKVEQSEKMPEITPESPKGIDPAKQSLMEATDF